MNITFSSWRNVEKMNPAKSDVGMESVVWVGCDPEQGGGLYAGGGDHLLKLELTSTPFEKC